MNHRDTLRQWLVALVCAGWMAVPGSVRSQTGPAPVVPAESVRLLEARGKVDVLQGGRRLMARANQSLSGGDHVQTWTNSHANLIWYDHMPFQVSELSDVVIPPPPGANKRGTLEVLKGFLYFFHRGQPGRLEIRTPTAAAIVIGTEFSVQVAADGSTVLRLFDGQVEVTTPFGVASVNSGEQAAIAPGQRPFVTPIVQGINDLIQWFLYYPGVLDLEEAGLSPPEEQALAASLAAYRAGDLREALAAYPAGRVPASDAEKIYVAALLLTVGQTDRAEGLLASLTAQAGQPAALAASLRKVVATVKGRVDATPLDLRLATSLLAGSYQAQSRADLTNALANARTVTRQAPGFGFGWARLAEMEFSFGRTTEALAAVERALELSPRNAQALALKGFLLTAQNKITKAIEFFDQAIELDGGLGNAWLGRGLCRIRRGETAVGREDLLVAAAVEPQRSLLRSYLGKALADAGEARRALQELQLARHLDTNDPTPLLYSALLNQEYSRINTAVVELEESQRLNNQRMLYRSRQLLDSDGSVRGANLAGIYRDAGLSDVSVREATRAVSADYANYSAHLFLANSYNELRDPRQVNLRYETPWLSEYLMANLLAPVGAGTLSPTVSQQEYSKLFERDRLGLVSRTEYRSTGDWLQSAAQFGIHGNFSYLLEANYRNETGQRPNNDQDQLTLSLQLKQQVAPRDTVFAQAIYYHAKAGDLTQYYDPAQANPAIRFHETQEPLLLAGLHHEWNPANHTLLIGGRLQDTLSFDNPFQDLLVLNRQSGQFNELGVASATNDYRSDLVSYFAEAQHIWKGPRQTMVTGARYQTGTFETRSELSQSALAIVGVIPVRVPAGATDVHPDFDRFGVYAYDHIEVTDSLLLTAGVSYDHLHFPENIRVAPLSSAEGTRDQVSPKAGITWQPARGTTVRGAYTRSLGGASIDQSFRLEPTQVGGFNQAFRSLIPEAVGGNVPGARFETLGAAVEQKFNTGLYLGLEAEWLRSDAAQTLGSENFTYTVPPLVLSFFPGSVQRKLDYDERSLTLTVNQLIGEGWSLGARYRVSQAELTTRFPGIPAEVGARAGFDTTRDEEALLHQMRLFTLYNHPSGFFAEFDARWYFQQNSGYSGALSDSDFWQFDTFAGYRFPRRRAEIRLGLLNLNGQDYRLNPLNLLGELPRRRTFTASLQFQF